MGLAALPEGVADGVPVGVPETDAVSVAEGVAEGVPLGVPDGVLVGVPEGVAEAEVVAVPEGVDDGVPVGVAEAEAVGGRPFPSPTPRRWRGMSGVRRQGKRGCCWPG